jgi:outer membrane protein OmpA-like peptidoglycan-associated protein
VARGLGLEAGLQGLLLAAGAAPGDPALAPLGAATAIGATLGPRIRPLADPDPAAPAIAGPWIAAAGGAALTGGLGRAALDASAGWDFALGTSGLGLGPMIAWLHVAQPDDAIRPDDADVVLLGVHLVHDLRGPAPERDRDHDGIGDRHDRCPDDPEDRDGFEDADGCPERDNDRDGVEDDDDRCPLVAEDRDGFEDADGCPDSDNDRDGLLDPKDRCPDDPEDRDGFEDTDGCPDRDDDRDGILDADDLCPREPEVKNGYADHDGCPDSEQIRVLGDKIVLDDHVHFRVNSAIIRVVSHPLLERLARLIVDNPSYVHIEIQGHTDVRGPEWFNQKLSADRAGAVLEFLVEHGVERARLSAVGFGASQPLVDRHSEHAWYMNRRVDFHITRQTEEIQRSPLPQARPKDDGLPPAGEKKP